MSDGHGATPDPPHVHRVAPWERPIEPAGSHPHIETPAEIANTPWSPPPALSQPLPEPVDDLPTPMPMPVAQRRPPNGAAADRPAKPTAKPLFPDAPPARAARPAAARQPTEAAPPARAPKPVAQGGAAEPAAPRRAAKAKTPRPTATPAAQPLFPASDADSAPLSVASLLAREGASAIPRSRRRAKDESDDPPPEPEQPESTRPAPAPATAPKATRRAPAPPPKPPRPAPAPVPWPDEGHTDVFPATHGELPDLGARAIPARVGNPAAAVRNVDEKSRRSKRPVYVGRTMAAVIAISSMALTGGAWQWSNVKNSHLNRIDALDPNSHDIRDPNGQYGDENFLIIGVDTRAGENSDMGAGDVSDAEGTRSDTIMLVNIPANRKRVAVVSFPRDLAITPTLCETWNDDSKTYGPEKAYTETKLNSAFAYGGPKCLVKVIQKISGLNINRFLGVDFAGFAKMVDALGGVEVCSPTPLKDYELGTVLENAGRQTIDGRTALQYVRARQVTTEYNGDYGRIKRQQLFLSSLLRSMISHNTFFSMSKLNNVVNTFIEDSYVDNIKTKDLVDLGQSLQDVSAGRITFLTIPTDGTDTEGNETPRTTDIRKIFDAIINDDPLPGELQSDGTRVPMPGTSSPDTKLASTEYGASELGETSTATPTPAETPPAEAVDLVTTEPGEVNVHVSNSTGQAGLASAAARQLSQYGFSITTKDDYPVPLSTTTVFFAPGHEQQAATVASAFGGAKLQRVTGSHSSSVRVVLGNDYVSTGAPLIAGSPIQLQLTSGTMAPTELPVDLTVVNASDTTCE